MTQFTIDRRSFFKGAGALVVAFAVPRTLAEAETASAVKPPLAPDQLDSWLAIKADGDVVAYFGKMDMGQGVDVAIAQIVAEELDVPLARVGVVMGDTALTVNQGGASGSTGVQKGGIALRNAAAEARRVLVDMASAQLGVPADRLEVTDGIVAVSGDPARRSRISRATVSPAFSVYRRTRCTASGSRARAPRGATTPATPASMQPCCQRRWAARGPGDTRCS